MSGYCPATYLRGWVTYLGYLLIPLAIIFLLVRIGARKNLKIYDEFYKKSWKNQEEMIALLKEIRDSLKNK
jgi:large-conductance mechanosensitive channel